MEITGVVEGRAHLRQLSLEGGVVGRDHDLLTLESAVRTEGADQADRSGEVDAVLAERPVALLLDRVQTADGVGLLQLGPDLPEADLGLDVGTDRERSRDEIGDVEAQDGDQGDHHEDTHPLGHENLLALLCCFEHPALSRLSKKQHFKGLSCLFGNI